MSLYTCARRCRAKVLENPTNGGNWNAGHHGKDFVGLHVEPPRKKTGTMGGIDVSVFSSRRLNANRWLRH